MDFHEQLRRQIRFLTTSCRLYDEGDVVEAIRIAMCLRIIFHTTRSSTSLLTHLGADACLLVSTVMAIRGRTDVVGLVDMRFVARIGESFRAHAKLDRSPHRRYLPFDEWWNHEPILNAGCIERTRATRRDLVLWAANQDGGAHVDASLAASYEAISRGFGIAIKCVGTDEEEFPVEDQVTTPLEHLHLASLRQVAYEVLASPDFLKLVP